MSGKPTPVRSTAMLVLAALVVAALVGYWQYGRVRDSSSSSSARVPIRGGDGGGLPVAEPRDEHLDGDALERASHDPAAAGLAAFIVMRHGHLVFERFGRGVSAQSMIDSGPFARVLVALLTGVAVHQRILPASVLSHFDPSRLRVEIERGTHQRYPDYLSHELWSPLNAAPAWIALPAADAADATVPADCCFHARVLDWLRVAGLLVNDGNFEDRQVIPVGWVTRMRRAVAADRGFGIELGSKVGGAQTFVTDDIFYLRGPGHWRLWLMPGMRLAVLFGAAGSGTGASWDESRLPNLVISALTDRPPSPQPGSLLRQLVPGH